MSNNPIIWCDNLSSLASLESSLPCPYKENRSGLSLPREKVVCRDVVVKFMSTSDQLADILTKCLPSSGFTWLHDKLLLPIQPPWLAEGC